MEQVDHNAPMSKVSPSAHLAFSGEIASVRSASRRPWPALLAGLLWLAAGLSAGYWVLQALGRAPVTPVPAMASAPPVVDAALLARALGALPAATPLAMAAPVAASRYALQGVVAVGSARGVALIGVDGQPARPFRVGAEVVTGMVLQSVTKQQVRLGASLDSPAAVTLDMPDMPGKPAG
jgi:general secretion pathway protein C